MNCLIEQHKGHTIQQLPESFEIVQQEINQLLIKMNERLSQLTKLDQIIQSQNASLDQSCDQVVQSINENFEIIKNQLQQK